MMNCEAAVGLEQLKKYPDIISKRREKALFYDQNLERREGWELPPIIEGATYSHYTVRVPERAKVINEFARKKSSVGGTDTILHTYDQMLQEWRPLPCLR